MVISSNSGGTDDWFSGLVTSIDHHFVPIEDLLSWELNTHVVTSDHDTVHDIQNFIKPFHALMIPDFSNNFGVSTFHTKQLMSPQHCTSSGTERCKMISIFWSTEKSRSASSYCELSIKFTYEPVKLTHLQEPNFSPFLTLHSKHLGPLFFTTTPSRPPSKEIFDSTSRTWITFR